LGDRADRHEQSAAGRHGVIALERHRRFDESCGVLVGEFLLARALFF
jgi:hypothetical protein